MQVRRIANPGVTVTWWFGMKGGKVGWPVPGSSLFSRLVIQLFQIKTPGFCGSG